MDAISELKEDWKRVDRALIPEKLLGEMPQPECKGLTLLTDVMINATVCKLGPKIGQITAPYSDDIEIILDVAVTIERRIVWRPGLPIDMNFDGQNRGLKIWVRNSETGANSGVCIVAAGRTVPAIDDCVSFVLWAESGFPDPPDTLLDRIEYVRDPELYKKNQAIKREEQERQWHLVIEENAERIAAYSKLDLERQRVRNLGWHELIAEHESAGPPDDDISFSLYHLRNTLLSMPVPGHPIGQLTNDLNPGGMR